MCVKIVCRWSKLLYCSKLKQVKHEPGNGDKVDRERIANGTGIWNLKIWICSPNPPQDFSIIIRLDLSICEATQEFMSSISPRCPCHFQNTPRPLRWKLLHIAATHLTHHGGSCDYWSVHAKWSFRMKILWFFEPKHGPAWGHRSQSIPLLYLYFDLYFYKVVFYITYLYLPLSAFSHYIYLCPENCWLE